MLIFIKKVFLVLFLSCCVFSQEEDFFEEKKEICPVSISREENANFIRKGDYLEKVIEVLKFDLNNSGFTCVVDKNEKNIRFIFKLITEGSLLKAYIYNIKTGEERFLDAITFTKDISLDRKKIHKLFDNFLLNYLNKRSIAQTKIIYSLRTTKEKNKYESEIWMCDYDGGNKQKLTFNNQHGVSSYNVSPSFVFSKEKKEIPDFIFVSYKTGIPKIYFSTDREEKRLISLRGNQLLPSLSKNFKYLSFISDISGRPDLFLQRFDKNKNLIGRPIQLYSFLHSVQASSSFSPDGKKLAFVSNKDGAPKIYVMTIPNDFGNNKRPEATLITKKNQFNVTPSWSNDGTKLAYSAKTKGIGQIWIYDFIKNEEKQLTKGLKNKENPSWAEDNLHVVYNSEEELCSELYIINLNDLKPVKTVTGIGQKRFPYWEKLY